MRYFFTAVLALLMLSCSNELVEDAPDWGKFEAELTRSGCTWQLRCEISASERVYSCVTETHVIYYHVAGAYSHPVEVSPLHADYLCFGQNQ